jgi:hypothetical protein
MAASIFLAKLIGPLLVIVAAALLVNPVGFKVMAQDFLNSRALMFLSGFILVPAGLAIVLTHNVWAADWRVLITLLGWLALIGGAIRIFDPPQLTRTGHTLLANALYMKIAAGLWLVIGLVLCFYGYRY